MTTSDLSIAFMVDQAPADVFKAINNVQGWWITTIEGDSHQLHDEFSVRFADIHYSRQRLTELIPDTRIVWLITDSHLSFLEDKTEWNGTQICFDISQKGDKTQVRFTHQGLVPGIECYNDCSLAWQGYIAESLRNLITTGKGQPYEVKTINA